MVTKYRVKYVFNRTLARRSSKSCAAGEKRTKLKMATEIALINPKTIGTELDKFIPQMERALPRHMTADRMARIALTSLRVNPKLMNCTRDSFYGSLMAASQLGLEPGINGQCYLIPYGNVCTLVPGWRGYMDLLNRTERAAARTEAVYDGDEFDYEMGTDLKIHHKRGKWSGNEDAVTHTYAVGKIKGIEGFPIIDVWDIDKIKSHRDKQNKVGNRHYSFEHLEMYARKIPLLQILKYLPSSIELADASALDVSATEGKQSLTIDMALKGELENGGDIATPSASDPIEHELDALFEKLGKNPAQQVELRKGYAGKTKELVDYLKGKLAPEIQGKPAATQSSAGVTAPEQQVTTSIAAGSQAIPVSETPVAAGLEVKRGRGRPSKEEMARRKAAEEAVAGQQPLPATETVSEPASDAGTAATEMAGSAFDLV